MEPVCLNLLSTTEVSAFMHQENNLKFWQSSQWLLNVIHIISKQCKLIGYFAEYSKHLKMLVSLVPSTMPHTTQIEIPMKIKAISQ